MRRATAGDTSAMAEGSAMAVRSATAVRSMVVARAVCGDETWQQYRLQVVIMVGEKNFAVRCGYFLYRMGSLELGGYDKLV